jgi:hypothetical protein
VPPPDALTGPDVDLPCRLLWLGVHIDRRSSGVCGFT